MRDVAHWTATERRDLFQETAAEMRVHPAIAEKDFWVCWMLDYLFHDSPWRSKLVFKGGTSLSKAYGLIERFSEDIDLVLDWRLLGYSSTELILAKSATQQDRLIKEAIQKTTAFLSEVVAPAMTHELTDRISGEFSIVAEGENILFRYPRAFRLDAIQPELRLEMGPMAAWLPQSVKTIRPYAATYFPEAFRVKTTSAPTIAAERTFWEKATILHQEAHRDAAKMLPPRYSRHYYDLYRMSLAPVSELALQQIDLLEEVVCFKRLFYRTAWANYDAAQPGTLRLLPPKHHRERLVEDYERMQTMLFGEVPKFDSMEDGLAELEHRINRLKL